LNVGNFAKWILMSDSVSPEGVYQPYYPWMSERTIEVQDSGLGRFPEKINLDIDNDETQDFSLFFTGKATATYPRYREIVDDFLWDIVRNSASASGFWRVFQQDKTTLLTINQWQSAHDEPNSSGSYLKVIGQGSDVITISD
jgi:hypothetical protein